jgi:predicted RNA binding protein YcfA (HicA-like mRNA interferase family)
LKPVSGKRLAAILKKRGWLLQRVKGSHHFFVHPDSNVPVNIPIHGPESSSPKRSARS